MSEKQPKPASPRVNPLVRDLLSADGGKVAVIGGFLGPAPEGRVRIYANLQLRTYVELPASDVVRVVDADAPDQPSTVFFRRDAELTYVQTATLRADQAADAAAAASPGCGGCGCGSGRAAEAARQTGGGPVVDLCVWACVERLRICEAQSGALGRLWCYLNYAFCRLGCIDPPIITV